jgi:AcrR family transcriptional regulator
MSGRPHRADAVRNRRLLLDAAGEAMRREPDVVTMPGVAEAAGLSVATAYRYFPTLPDLLNEYLYDVLVQLRDYSHNCTSTGLQLFSDVTDEWLRLVGVYGRTMVHLRPRVGLLARLHGGDATIGASRDAWERPLRAVMRQAKVPDPFFEAAFFLHNMIFDPREVLDLVDAGLPLDEVKLRLQGAFVGAVRGWADAT